MSSQIREQHLEVDPGKESTGVGPGLLRKLLDELRDADVEVVVAQAMPFRDYTLENAKRLKQFYEFFGFTQQQECSSVMVWRAP